MNVQPAYPRLAWVITGLVTISVYVQGFNTLCYWTVWSQGRPGDYGLKPSKIDPNLCSHLIYAFGIVAPGLTIGLEEDAYPAAPRSVREINNLKTENPELITLISLGGASKGPEAFLKPAANDSSRVQFAQNTVLFCREKGFDGVDIDWEYPTNGTSFTLFMKALRKAFDEEIVPVGKKRLLLTAAVSVASKKIDTIYDIPALNNALDFFNVMAYDFHGSWHGVAAFNTPLFARTFNPRIENSEQYNADWAVKRYIQKGASRSKIILGLASYGRAYQLTDRTQHGVGAPIERSARKGPVLEEEEFRMYPEVCDFITENRARYMFDEKQKSSFVYTIDFWIGYDGPKAFHTKTQYAIQERLGGVLLWTLDYDDVSGNHCGLGTFPLIKAVKNTVAGNTRLIPSGPLRPYEPFLELPKPAENADRYKRMCYFANWSTLRNAGDGLFTLSDVNPDTCTHLVYAFAFIDEVSYSVLPLYPNEESKSDAPADAGLMEKFNSIKRYNPSLRTLLSVGGSTAGTKAFQIVSKDDTSRRRFARNIIEYLDTWGFDGVDIVWIYPGNFRNQFTLLLQAMREEFDKYGAENNGVKTTLTASVSAENPQINDSYEIREISKHVDFLNVLAYTYQRKDNRTYFVSPLRNSRNDAATSQLNQEWSVEQWINGGAPPEKLLLGLTGMGRSFRLESNQQTAPGSAFIDQNVTSTILGEKGIMVQYEICDFINRGAEESFSSEQVAAYAHFNDIWVSYENGKSIIEKVKWLKSKGLAGFSFWSLDYDDFTGRHCNCGPFPMLTTAYQTAKGRLVSCFGGQTSPTNEASPGVTEAPIRTPPPELKPITTPEKPKTPKPSKRLIIVRDGANNISLSITSLIVLVLFQMLYFNR
ncbi:probable chitinase 10 [Liolophura sinensis]|uniref:probable chitinase 10 n=1 Tax=Liolophura sinensis TaxID=3198878 RepID=UPI0031591A33